MIPDYIMNTVGQVLLLVMGVFLTLFLCCGIMALGFAMWSSIWND